MSVSLYVCLLVCPLAPPKRRTLLSRKLGDNGFRLKKFRIQPTEGQKTEKKNTKNTDDKKDGIRVGFVIFSSINLLLKYIIRCVTDPKKHYMCTMCQT